MSIASSILPVLLRIEDRAAEAGNGLAWKNKMVARYRLV